MTGKLVMTEIEKTAGRPGKGQLLLAMSPPFLIGIAFGFGKIVRDCSLTCNVGYQFFPLVILVIAVLSFPLSAVSVRLAKRWGYRQRHTPQSLTSIHQNPD